MLYDPIVFAGFSSLFSDARLLLKSPLKSFPGMEPHTEQRPLLRSSGSNAANAEPGSPPVGRPGQRDSLAIALCVLIIFALSLGSAVQTTPLAEIYETIICRDYAHQGANRSAPDNDCKAPAVQAELSNVQAWQSTLDIIPGALVAVPYGALADKYSHKAVLQLSSVGFLLEIVCQSIICKSLQRVQI